MEGFIWYCVIGLITMIGMTIYLKVVKPFDYSDKFLEGLFQVVSLVLWFVVIPLGAILGLVWLVNKGVDFTVEFIKNAKAVKALEAEVAAKEKRAAELKAKMLDETQFQRSEETNWKPKTRKEWGL